ncbi:hypothetical protein LG277_12945 [Vreelandella aquamarina]|uniref:hypothetical protein n=1 Tax=Vreelandella aquamarina TaxID=77097 RepID=UPI00384BB031
MATVATDNLVLLIQLPDGEQLTVRLEELQGIELPEGARVTLVDANTGLPPADLAVKRDGDDLLLEVDGTQVATLADFFATPDAAFYPDGDFLVESADAVITADSSALAFDDNGASLLWSADEAGSTAMSGTGASDGSTSYMPYVLGAVGVGGVAALASGSDSSSSSPTLVVDKNDDGVISFSGTASGPVAIAFDGSNDATVTRDGVSTTTTFDLSDFDTNSEGADTLSALQLKAEDGATLTFSGNRPDLDAIVFDVEDGPNGAGQADRKNLTLNTADLEGVDSIIFAFEDESDFVVLSDQSDLSNFGVIEVQKGTADLSQVTVNDGAEFVVNSGVVLTFEQFETLASLSSSTGLGRLTIQVDSEEQVNQIQNILAEKVLIGFGEGEPGELDNIKIESATGEELDADAIESAISAIREASSPSLVKLDGLVAELEQQARDFSDRNGGDQLTDQVELGSLVSLTNDTAALKALVGDAEDEAGAEGSLFARISEVDARLTADVEKAVDDLNGRIDGVIGEGDLTDNLGTLVELGDALDTLQKLVGDITDADNDDSNVGAELNALQEQLAKLESLASNFVDSVSVEEDGVINITVAPTASGVQIFNGDQLVGTSIDAPLDESAFTFKIDEDGENTFTATPSVRGVDGLNLTIRALDSSDELSDFGARTITYSTATGTVNVEEAKKFADAGNSGSTTIDVVADTLDEFQTLIDGSGGLKTEGADVFAAGPRIEITANTDNPLTAAELSTIVAGGATLPGSEYSLEDTAEALAGLDAAALNGATDITATGKTDDVEQASTLIKAQNAGDTTLAEVEGKVESLLGLDLDGNDTITTLTVTDTATVAQAEALAAKTDDLDLDTLADTAEALAALTSDSDLLANDVAIVLTDEASVDQATDITGLDTDSAGTLTFTFAGGIADAADKLFDGDDKVDSDLTDAMRTNPAVRVTDQVSVAKAVALDEATDGAITFEGGVEGTLNAFFDGDTLETGVSTMLANGPRIEITDAALNKAQFDALFAEDKATLPGSEYSLEDTASALAGLDFAALNGADAITATGTGDDAATPEQAAKLINAQNTGDTTLAEVEGTVESLLGLDLDGNDTITTLTVTDTATVAQAEALAAKTDDLDLDTLADTAEALAALTSDSDLLANDVAIVLTDEASVDQATDITGLDTDSAGTLTFTFAGGIADAADKLFDGDDKVDSDLTDAMRTNPAVRVTDQVSVAKAVALDEATDGAITFEGGVEGTLNAFFDGDTLETGVSTMLANGPRIEITDAALNKAQFDALFAEDKATLPGSEYSLEDTASALAGLDFAALNGADAITATGTGDDAATPEQAAKLINAQNTGDTTLAEVEGTVESLLGLDLDGNDTITTLTVTDTATVAQAEALAAKTDDLDLDTLADTAEALAALTSDSDLLANDVAIVLTDEASVDQATDITGLDTDSAGTLTFTFAGGIADAADKLFDGDDKVDSDLTDAMRTNPAVRVTDQVSVAKAVALDEATDGAITFEGGVEGTLNAFFDGDTLETGVSTMLANGPRIEITDAALNKAQFDALFAEDKATLPGSEYSLEDTASALAGLDFAALNGADAITATGTGDDAATPEQAAKLINAQNSGTTTLAEVEGTVESLLGLDLDSNDTITQLTVTDVANVAQARALTAKADETENAPVEFEAGLSDTAAALVDLDGGDDTKLLGDNPAITVTDAVTVAQAGIIDVLTTGTVTYTISDEIGNLLDKTDEAFASASAIEITDAVTAAQIQNLTDTDDNHTGEVTASKLSFELNDSAANILAANETDIINNATAVIANDGATLDAAQLQGLIDRNVDLEASSYSLSDDATALVGLDAAALNGATDITATGKTDDVEQASTLIKAQNSGTTTLAEVEGTVESLLGLDLDGNDTITQLTVTDVANVAQARALTAKADETENAPVEFEAGLSDTAAALVDLDGGDDTKLLGDNPAITVTDAVTVAQAGIIDVLTTGTVTYTISDEIGNLLAQATEAFTNASAIEITDAVTAAEIQDLIDDSEAGDKTHTGEVTASKLSFELNDTAAEILAADQADIIDNATVVITNDGDTLDATEIGDLIARNVDLEASSYSLEDTATNLAGLDYAALNGATDIAATDAAAATPEQAAKLINAQNAGDTTLAEVEGTVESLLGLDLDGNDTITQLTVTDVANVAQARALTAKADETENAPVEFEAGLSDTAAALVDLDGGDDPKLLGDNPAITVTDAVTVAQAGIIDVLTTGTVTYTISDEIGNLLAQATEAFTNASAIEITDAVTAAEIQDLIDDSEAGDKTHTGEVTASKLSFELNDTAAEILAADQADIIDNATVVITNDGDTLDATEIGDLIARNVDLEASSYSLEDTATNLAGLDYAALNGATDIAATDAAAATPEQAAKLINAQNAGDTTLAEVEGTVESLLGLDLDGNDTITQLTVTDVANVAQARALTAKADETENAPVEFEAGLSDTAAALVDLDGGDDPKLLGDNPAITVTDAVTVAQAGIIDVLTTGTVTYTISDEIGNLLAQATEAFTNASAIEITDAVTAAEIQDLIDDSEAGDKTHTGEVTASKLSFELNDTAAEILAADQADIIDNATVVITNDGDTLDATEIGDLIARNVDLEASSYSLEDTATNLAGLDYAALNGATDIAATDAAAATPEQAAKLINAQNAGDTTLAEVEGTVESLLGLDLDGNDTITQLTVTDVANVAQARALTAKADETENAPVEFEAGLSDTAAALVDLDGGDDPKLLGDNPAITVTDAVTVAQAGIIDVLTTGTVTYTISDEIGNLLAQATEAFTNASAIEITDAVTAAEIQDLIDDSEAGDKTHTGEVTASKLSFELNDTAAEILAADQADIIDNATVVITNDGDTLDATEIGDLIARNVDLEASSYSLEDTATNLAGLDYAALNGATDIAATDAAAATPEQAAKLINAQNAGDTTLAEVEGTVESLLGLDLDGNDTITQLTVTDVANVAQARALTAKADETENAPVEFEAGLSDTAAALVDLDGGDDPKLLGDNPAITVTDAVTVAQAGIIDVLTTGTVTYTISDEIGNLLAQATEAFTNASAIEITDAVTAAEIQDLIDDSEAGDKTHTGEVTASKLSFELNDTAAEILAADQADIIDNATVVITNDGDTLDATEIGDLIARNVDLEASSYSLEDTATNLAGLDYAALNGATDIAATDAAAATPEQAAKLINAQNAGDTTLAEVEGTVESLLGLDLDGNDTITQLTVTDVANVAQARALTAKADETENAPVEFEAGLSDTAAALVDLDGGDDPKLLGDNPAITVTDAVTVAQAGIIDVLTTGTVTYTISDEIGNLLAQATEAFTNASAIEITDAVTAAEIQDLIDDSEAGDKTHTGEVTASKLSFELNDTAAEILAADQADIIDNATVVITNDGDTLDATEIGDLIARNVDLEASSYSLEDTATNLAGLDYAALNGATDIAATDAAAATPEQAAKLINAQNAGDTTLAEVEGTVESLLGLDLDGNDTITQLTVTDVANVAQARALTAKADETENAPVEFEAGLSDTAAALVDLDGGDDPKLLGDNPAITVTDAVTVAQAGIIDVLTTGTVTYTISDEIGNLLAQATEAFTNASAIEITDAVTAAEIQDLIDDSEAGDKTHTGEVTASKLSFELNDTAAEILAADQADIIDNATVVITNDGDTLDATEIGDLIARNVDLEASSYSLEDTASALVGLDAAALNGATNITANGTAGDATTVAQANALKGASNSGTLTIAELTANSAEAEGFSFSSDLTVDKIIVSGLFDDSGDNSNQQTVDLRHVPIETDIDFNGRDGNETLLLPEGPAGAAQGEYDIDMGDGDDIVLIYGGSGSDDSRIFDDSSSFDFGSGDNILRTVGQVDFFSDDEGTIKSATIEKDGTLNLVATEGSDSIVRLEAEDVRVFDEIIGNESTQIVVKDKVQEDNSANISERDYRGVTFADVDSLTVEENTHIVLDNTQLDALTKVFANGDQEAKVVSDVTTDTNITGDNINVEIASDDDGVGNLEFEVDNTKTLTLTFAQANELQIRGDGTAEISGDASADSDLTNIIDGVDVTLTGLSADVQTDATITLKAVHADGLAFTGDGAVVVTALADTPDADLSGIATDLTIDLGDDTTVALDQATSRIDVAENKTLTIKGGADGNTSSLDVTAADAFAIDETANIVVDEFTTLTLTAAQADGVTIEGAGTVVVTELDATPDADLDNISTAQTINLGSNNDVDSDGGTKFSLAGETLKIEGNTANPSSLDVTTAGLFDVTGDIVVGDNTTLTLTAEQAAAAESITGDGSVIITDLGGRGDDLGHVTPAGGVTLDITVDPAADAAVGAGFDLAEDTAYTVTGSKELDLTAAGALGINKADGVDPGTTFDVETGTTLKLTAEQAAAAESITGDGSVIITDLGGRGDDLGHVTPAGGVTLDITVDPAADAAVGAGFDLAEDTAYTVTGSKELDLTAAGALGINKADGVDPGTTFDVETGTTLKLTAEQAAAAESITGDGSVIITDLGGRGDDLGHVTPAGGVTLDITVDPAADAAVGAGFDLAEDTAYTVTGSKELDLTAAGALGINKADGVDPGTTFDVETGTTLKLTAEQAAAAESITGDGSVIITDLGGRGDDLGHVTPAGGVTLDITVDPAADAAVGAGFDLAEDTAYTVTGSKELDLTAAGALGINKADGVDPGTTFDVETGTTLKLTAEQAAAAESITGDGSVIITDLGGRGDDLGHVTPAGGVTLDITVDPAADAAVGAGFDLAEDTAYTVTGSKELDLTAAGALGINKADGVDPGTTFDVETGTTLKLTAEQAAAAESITGDGSVIITDLGGRGDDLGHVTPAGGVTLDITVDPAADAAVGAGFDLAEDTAYTVTGSKELDLTAAGALGINKADGVDPGTTFDVETGTTLKLTAEQAAAAESITGDGSVIITDLGGRGDDLGHVTPAGGVTLDLGDPDNDALVSANFNLAADTDYTVSGGNKLDLTAATTLGVDGNTTFSVGGTGTTLELTAAQASAAGNITGDGTVIITALDSHDDSLANVTASNVTLDVSDQNASVNGDFELAANTDYTVSGGNKLDLTAATTLGVDGNTTFSVGGTGTTLKLTAAQADGVTIEGDGSVVVTEFSDTDDIDLSDVNVTTDADADPVEGTVTLERNDIADAPSANVTLASAGSGFYTITGDADGDSTFTLKLPDGSEGNTIEGFAAPADDAASKNDVLDFSSDEFGANEVKLASRTFDSFFEDDEIVVFTAGRIKADADDVETAFGNDTFITDGANDLVDSKSGPIIFGIGDDDGDSIETNFWLFEDTGNGDGGAADGNVQADELTLLLTLSDVDVRDLDQENFTTTGA